MVEVITLTRTFTDAGKHGVATVLLSNIINELHHVDGFAHTGATKQADLTTLSERQIRSITLMPVSRRSTDGESSSNFGATL